MASLKSHELRIEITQEDLPEDRFSAHVNNARYFAFINKTFHGWYVRMGLRDVHSEFSAAMAHLSYDFMREVHFPGTVLCKLTLMKVGRTSIEHAIEMWDVSAAPCLVGRGRAVHVGINRHTSKPALWPAELLALCWDQEEAQP